MYEEEFTYIPFDTMIQSPDMWQDMVRELAPSFKTPRFPLYTQEQYSENRHWQAVQAINGRVPMASMINPYDGKPEIGSAKPIDLDGEMPTFGNKVSFTSKEFNRIDEIERAIERKINGPKAMLDYIRSYMERLYVGPLVAVDKIFFDAWSDGTSIIAAEDNLAKLSMSLDWELPKYNVAVSWDNQATATGITDLYDFYWTMRNVHGVIIDTFTLNRKTLNQLLRQQSTQKMTTYFNVSNKTVKWEAMPSLDTVNTVLESNFGLPKIQVEDYMIDIYDTDGISIKKTINAFKDGRVSGHNGNNIGTYLWSPADEQRRPDKDGTIYQTINNVLVSTRQSRGKVTYESELNAIAIPTLNDQMGVLVTDATSGNTALPTY